MSEISSAGLDGPSNSGLVRSRFGPSSASRSEPVMAGGPARRVAYDSMTNIDFGVSMSKREKRANHDREGPSLSECSLIPAA